MYNKLNASLDTTILVYHMEEFLKKIGLHKKIKFTFKPDCGHRMIVKDPDNTEMQDKLNSELDKMKVNK